MIYAQALILTILIEAVACLTHTFDPPLEALSLLKYRDATIILCDAVVDSILVIRGTFVVTGARAFCPVLKAYYLTENWYTRVEFIQTRILAYLVKTSATRIGACQLLMHTLLLSLDRHTCIVFKLAIVQALLAFLGKSSGYPKCDEEY